MADYREDMAAAIAEKYLELYELSRESSAYGAIRLDWARYREDGLDDILITFMDGLDEFDNKMDGAMNDEDYVRHTITGIMDEHNMTDEQRSSFLNALNAYASQAGADSLNDALSGNKESVMRALVQMSKSAQHKGNADAAMDDICKEAVKRRHELRRQELMHLSGEKADELLRCYAAYCVLRDGADGCELNGECFKLIGTTVRAGDKQAETLEKQKAGHITGEQAAEVLRTIAEVVLTALALFLSCAAGSLAFVNVMQLAGMLFGFTGVMSAVGVSLGLMCALPAGVLVTRDMIRLCARAGLWLERNALEPGAQKVAQLFDECGKWLSRNIAPGAQKAWQDVYDAISNVRPQVENAWNNTCRGAQNAWNGVKPHIERAADGAWHWMEHSANDMGDALDKLLTTLHMNPDGDNA